jgi:biopolymer transport protein ExbB
MGLAATSHPLFPKMKIHRFWRALGATSVLLFLLTAPAAAFQEGEAAPAHGKKTKSWLELFESTGMVGYLMLGCSIAGTTLVIEHIVSLRREKLAPEAVAADLEALINEEEYDEAVALCDEAPCYLTNVVGAALRMRDAGYQEMIAGLEASAGEEAFKLNTKISYLSLIGNVAPLLGLLGTVTGMISSFQIIETLKAPTPGDLAKGVYESLVNTTLGLFIAILFLTIYFVFKNKVSKMSLSINLQAVDMMRHLAIAEKAAA